MPILNFWVGYRCFACPAGYAYHKKLDGVGIFLAIVYWLMIAVVLLAVAAVIAVLLGAVGSPELQQQFHGRHPQGVRAQAVIQYSKQADERREAGPLECWCLHGAVGMAADWRGFAKNLAAAAIGSRAVDLWRFLDCCPHAAHRTSAKPSTPRPAARSSAAAAAPC